MRMQPPVRRDFSETRPTEHHTARMIMQPQKRVVQKAPDVQKKDKRGRPPIVFTPILVQEILAAFQNGWTDEKVCEHVHIARNTLYKQMRENQQFMNDVTLAKNHHLILAGERITGILEKGEDREAGPMARWIYEKRLKEMYGDDKIKPEQNNFIILTHDAINAIFKQRSPIENSTPAELLKSLEVQSDESNVDFSGKEESAA
jgi:uncharacterized protein (DUF433 family)